MSGEAWVAIAGMCIAALAWLFRLEGRQTTHEAVCAERYREIKEDLNEIKTTLRGEYEPRD